jgi:inorganic triphosphatase YgiF
MIKIQLTEQNIKKCDDRVNEMVDHYNKVGIGSYGHNKPSSVLKGLRAEVAFDQWISDKLPDSLIERPYEDFKNRKVPDFKLGQRITEVKSLDKKFWKTLGRMITPDQLPRYKRNNALVVWACSTEREEDHEVWLMGWNNAKDFTSLNTKRIRTICDNIWLYREEDMRAIDTLLISRKTENKKNYERVSLL